MLLMSDSSALFGAAVVDGELNVVLDVVVVVVDLVVVVVDNVVVLLLAIIHFLLLSFAYKILSLDLATNIWSWRSLTVIGLLYRPLLYMLVSNEMGIPR